MSPAGVDLRTDHSQSPSGAWADWSVREFLALKESDVLGALSRRFAESGHRTLESDQIDAWRIQWQSLRAALQRLQARHPDANEWRVAFEYEIPRRARRIDAVVLTPTVVIVLEFKTGATRHERADLWQTQDYRCDLQDFHELSRGLPIDAVLVATESTVGEDSVDPQTKVWKTNANRLADSIAQIVARHGQAGTWQYSPADWLRSGYRPTPTILETARRVFAGHDIRELSHAYADNLTTTTKAIQSLIEDARRNRRRLLCFVTGVPGAGKTLAGLTATQDVRAPGDETTIAAFMSGNGPLVSVVREALIRDRVKKGGTRATHKREVDLLAQNVHRFIEEYGLRRPNSAPPEHMIAFDEAQRAWHATKVAKRHEGVTQSEPALVLDIMSRPKDWAVVIALVGGGQEIHDGEAGLEAWGEAVLQAGVPWDIAVSPDVLRGGESVAGHRLFKAPPPHSLRYHMQDSLHLSVSVRSPKAQRLAAWVNAVLRHDPEAARSAIDKSSAFRILLTRDLSTAKNWLRSSATGDLRAGLLASSGALRLRAHGIEVDAAFRKGFPYVRWFLDPPNEYRSSNSLEVAATDFECQGLEIDYSCVCWGDDLVVEPTKPQWSCKTLRGSSWHAIRDPIRQQYLLNKYRVLLTRSREGMVIWVPRGDASDPTRPPEPLDRTAELLEAAGATWL